MDDASSEPKIMSLDLLREITNGFSEERKLGSGSFGMVYLGVHPDGEKIAVKKLYDMPGHDDKQFLNEFMNLTRLRHQNIVRLVGYCHDIKEEQVKHEGKLVLAEKTHRALCLEYMSNGSLDKYLSDECDRYDWHTCYRIIRGICQGLKYLHNELIYHFDLKPANVLLDENMVPRIADFGTSRLFGDEHTRCTQSSLGTLGYIPPEFIRSNFISNKFDIFSLGVVIIKMMAGRPGYSKSAEMPSQEFTNLVQENWTNRLLETLNQRTAYSKQVKTCIEIGLSCVQEDRHKRPTIQNIIYKLEKTESKCTYAARKDRLLISQSDLVRKFTNSGNKITCGPLPKVERAPVFSAHSCGICSNIFDSQAAARYHRCQYTRAVMVHKSGSGGRAIAMACTTVGGGMNGSMDLCAKVCLIGEDESVLFQAFVKPTVPVTNYRYDVTGIRPEYLRDAMPLKRVQKRIQDILCNRELLWKIRPRSYGGARILVGHGVDQDLDLLGLEYPTFMIRDTAKYPPLMKTTKLSNTLEYLSQAYLGSETSYLGYTISAPLNLSIMLKKLHALSPFVGMISTLAISIHTMTVWHR